MNIKEHIEAGHYPKDEKGRALVPTRGSGTYTIVCTDRPGMRPIMGFAPACCDSIQSWKEDGAADSDPGHWDILPPPPRKDELERLRELQAMADRGDLGILEAVRRHLPSLLASARRAQKMEEALRELMHLFTSTEPMASGHYNDLCDAALDKANAALSP